MKTSDITLSIIVLNYNTRDVTKNCLKSIELIKDKVKHEVIVVDNGSTDGSVEMIKKDFPKVVLIENKTNLGFAAGNNRARDTAQGAYILFLNSDTEVRDGVLDESVKYFKESNHLGALTCKTILPSGELDRDARRSFPTPWVALTHFSYLDRIFPKSKLFAKYWYWDRDPDEAHEVDVVQGAFLLTRKDILEKIDWFDEDYFLDGEDIDLCWKIKSLGYKIIYYPKVSILHLKKASKRESKGKSVSQGLRSMEIFYKKNLWQKYPIYINLLVLLGIQLMKVVRIINLHI